ncbi:hypothetical protein [uncultured Paracoccus sp.]|uniref:hypothetical protein n=1 Tax=uncultured Paracoccus sp. TaxID=189685 RepID=UPI0025CE30FE|nr:hypothetical protein [uncultured Paracoccus sp.]
MLEPTADLCATLMELPHTAGLVELALIRRELGEVDDESPETYSGPRSSMKLAQARHHHDPWPIIEAIRAPSWEIVEAAAGLGISVKGWVEGSTEVVERARFLFPDHSPLKVGLVVLSAGLVCARTEFEVKAVVGRAIPARSPGSPGSTIDGFWPEGASAAREHMLSLLRLEALELQFPGATAGSDRAAQSPLEQRIAPVRDEARRAGLHPDGSDDKGLMDDLSGDI